MKKKTVTPGAGSTGKKDSNKGSSAFNQGSEQDSSYNEGTKVTDEEKRTGHLTSLGKKKENPQDGNIGKNNAGGYK